MTSTETPRGTPVQSLDRRAETIEAPQLELELLTGKLNYKLETEQDYRHMQIQCASRCPGPASGTGTEKDPWEHPLQARGLGFWLWPS